VQRKETGDDAEHTNCLTGCAILVWPNIVMNSNTDTLIQLSNTDTSSQKRAHCFYVDANQHCSNDPSKVCTKAITDCTGGGFCVPGWNEIDFDVIITPKQPLAWSASSGLQDNFPLQDNPHCQGGNMQQFCNTDADCGGGQCVGANNNLGSGVPPVPESPFVGSLTCIEYTNDNPPQLDTANTLIGHATIESESTTVDAQKYNAVGLRATGSPAPTNPLQIGGGSGAEYEACPTKLILNHLFDGGVNPIGRCASDTPIHECSTDKDCGTAGPCVFGTSSTTLTLVPCGNDFLRQQPGVVTAQFLVFNEFEQRFSASRLVDCFFQSPISNIDTPSSLRSIFSAKVAGTLAGQTWIRGAGTAASGRGLLGSASVKIGGSSAAYDLHEKGDPPADVAPDIITLP
jgi:hypothetical protein